MPSPRLVGPPVRLLRQALASPLLARAIWAVAARDLRLSELSRIPPEQLDPVDPAPVPIAGRRSHTWDDAELGPPPVTAARTAGSRWRAAFANGLSPVDVVNELARRHQELGPRSPFVLVDVARASAAAEASAGRWRRGTPLGPLDGLVVPVTDEFHLRGHPTRGGTTYLTDLQSDDAWVVKQLEAGGAIVLGKTHCTEWGLNPFGVLEHQTGPRNPYDGQRAPGGSSTGAGVAAALGLCPSAVGSDRGGSIRISGCLNGLFGLKPTYVRVGRTGDTWGSSTVAHIGPIGQTTADCVEQLSVTAGVDPDDSLTRFAPDDHGAGPWRAALGRGVRGCRIGVLREELQDAEPRVAALVEEALVALRSDGATLVDVALPFGDLVSAIGSLTVGSEAMENLRDDFAVHGSRFGDELAILVQMMQLVPAKVLVLVARARAHLRRAVAALLADVDLLALPTTATTAPIYREREDRQPVLDTAATSATTRFSFLANLTGLPAGTVPVGLVDGLPAGLQLVGDAWDEASVIATMAQLERLGVSDAVPRPGGFAVPW